MRRALSVFCAILTLLAFSLCAAAENTVYSFIRLGDSGRQIRAVQRLLNVVEKDAQGEYCFGEKTKAAVEAYQRREGVAVTGELTPETLCALMDESDASQLVWIPLKSGECYHCKASCSRMKSPRQVPLACAEKLMTRACKKCFRLTKCVPYLAAQPAK